MKKNDFEEQHFLRGIDKAYNIFRNSGRVGLRGQLWYYRLKFRALNYWKQRV